MKLDFSVSNRKLVKFVKVTFFRIFPFCRQHDKFKDQYFQPYVPTFADGWVPPEIIVNEKQEAAVKSTAMAVARMQVFIF